MHVSRLLTFSLLLLRLQLSNLVIRAKGLEVMVSVDVMDACDELLRELCECPVSPPSASLPRRVSHT